MLGKSRHCQLTPTERRFFNANYRMVVSWKMQDVIVRAQNMKHGLAKACDHIFFAFGFASRCVHQDDSFAAWLIAYKFN